MPLELEITPWPFPIMFSFRHAVCLVDCHGAHMPATPESRELATELLTEYGTARGGTPLGEPFIRRFDFNKVGYCMEFDGGPTEPTLETRLKLPPRVGAQPMAGMEELYVVPSGE